MNRNRVPLCFLLLLALSLPAAAAPSPWVEVSSAHFTLLTNAGEKEGRHLLDQFERMRWVFQQLFPQANVDPAVPIVVVAAKDSKTFATLEPAEYLGKGKLKLGGYFQHGQDKNYILLRLDTETRHPFETVYHEYTHVEFASSGDFLPLWLNEGTAEFFQNTEFEGKQVKLGEPSPDDLLYLRQTSLIPLNVLFSVDHNSPYYHNEQKGSVFYSESWALTHYLMVTEHLQHTDQLSEYTTLVRNHQDPVAAAEQAFGDLKQLQKALEGYIRQATYQEFVLNSAAAPIDESAFQATPLTASQADAVRADVMALIGRTQEARALAAAVLQADPNNVQAHETLGWLASRAGQWDEARNWYGQAVQLHSQDFLAYYYFAQISMRTGSMDEAIESSLRTAIRLNPRFAYSYDCLASYYAMRHAKLEEAHRLNLQAIELDPQSVSIRLNASGVLLAMGRYDDAIAVLQKALPLATTPEQTAVLQNRMTRIESYKAQRTPVFANLPADVRSTVQPVVRAKELHPVAAATGPALSAVGTMRGVECNYPSEIEFRLVMTAGKQLNLYNNNFPKLDVTAAAGFTPPKSMNPCQDFEGLHARVQYVKTADQTMDGQVNAIELRK